MLSQACLAMKTIMNDTLDYSKIESGAFQILLAPNRLQKMIEQTIFTMTPFAKETDHDVELVLQYDTNIPNICLFDSGRLQQVVANMVSNAVKFANHGKVVISANYLPDGEDIYLAGVHWQNDHKFSTPTISDAGHSLVPDKKIDEPNPLNLAVNGQKRVETRVSLPSRSITDSEKELIAAASCSLIPVNDVEVRQCTIIVSVKDYGVGISEDDMGSLFQEFRQLNAGLRNKQIGSGLGLAICREIVTLHKGRIGVRSSGVAGEGSEFLIALRLAVLEENTSLSSPTINLVKPTKIKVNADPHFEKNRVSIDADIVKIEKCDVVKVKEYNVVMRILVVDDVASNRKLLRKMIMNRLKHLIVLNGEEVSSVRVEIDEAEDGHHAIELLTGTDRNFIAEYALTGKLPVDCVHPHPEYLTKYDCITMDAQMPTLSGYTTTKMLRAAGYLGSIYGCTGNSLDVDIKLFLDRGANQVFTKPVSVDALTSAILEEVGSTWQVHFQLRKSKIPAPLAGI